MRATWDIFCRVVDNYGDIGVCWRLARQLVAEHDQRVRLWVDDLDTFYAVSPSIDPESALQFLAGVEIYRWEDEWADVAPGDVVIEAFACQTPPAYVAVMTKLARPCLWLNLEYLSAESWVDECHGLPSPQAGFSNKYFFFPGFTRRTGGLLRETELLSMRDRFQEDVQAQDAFLAPFGVVRSAGARLISLFAYECDHLDSWLDELSVAEETSHLLVPAGKSLADIKRWLGVATLQVGDVNRKGALTVHILPFLPQHDYDRLLWACDFNVVRGEDSFVRAIWAGKPMVWHIYRQDENAHLLKLEAYLERYCAELSPAAALAVTTFWRQWNVDEAANSGWNMLQEVWPELSAHTASWCRELAGQNDLVTSLVQFHRNWV